MIENNEKALNGFDSFGGGIAPAIASEPKLNIFAQVYDRVIRANNRNVWSDYKVFISEETISNNNSYGSAYNKGSASNGSSAFKAKVYKKRVINFWAFSPGIAMEVCMPSKNMINL